MAYQTLTKHSTKLSADSKKNQQGVTLLLTLMIMASLSAIVFSISAIALNEVRTASNEANSEPAITGAEGVAEEQLFQDVRGVNTTCASSGYENFGLSGVHVTYVNSYYYAGAYNFGIPSGGEQDFYIYNPCIRNGPPGYTSITVQLQNGSVANATVDLCSWNNQDCANNPDLGQAVLSPGGSVTFPSSQIDPSTQYVIAIQYGNSAFAGNLSIQTTATDPQITGIPAADVTIITTGSKGGTTRKLQTQLPQ